MGMAGLPSSSALPLFCFDWIGLGGVGQRVCGRATPCVSIGIARRVLFSAPVFVRLDCIGMGRVGQHVGGGWATACV